MPSSGRALLGAAFLMATSAIGPGFLTQTVVFTGQLEASFGFAILLSILFDLAAQLTVWRVIVAAGVPAQVLGNTVVKGLGTLLAVLVAIGGLAFNIGNVAGAGLGLEALIGLDVKAGAALSAAIAIGLFLSREAGRAMDRFAQVMGGLMIALCLWVAVSASPPVGEALLRTVLPARIDALAIVTIVGGTVGGYITFAGAHRLLDAGITGPGAVPAATRAASAGIGVATLMRILLFLAALGVVASGQTLDPANPPASMFRHAAGELGGRLFGAVMWSAAVTSIVGSAYTSVSFIRTLHPRLSGRATALLIGFVSLSALVFVAVGNPVTILIVVGALNAMILPLGLAVVLLATRSRQIVGDYRHPPALFAAAAVTAVVMAGLGAWTFVTRIPPLFR